MDNKKVTINELNSGEFVGLSVIKIKSIPDISVLRPQFDSTKEANLAFQRQMSGALSETHQIYRSLDPSPFKEQYISLELLWLAEPAQNQIYAADIQLYIIIRNISSQVKRAKEQCVRINEVIKNMLLMQRYEFEEISFDQLYGKLQGVDCSSIYAVVKDERVEAMQSPLMPVCYCYDQINSSGTALSKISNALINAPYSAVSIQLIATRFTSDEQGVLGQTSQILDMLSKGIADRNMGNIRYSQAEAPAKIYRYYEESKAGALFQYNFVVYGSSLNADNLATSI